jgi:hypothetical protein
MRTSQPELVTSLWPQLLPDPPGPARRIVGAVYVSSRTEDLPVARARERHSLAVDTGRRVEWVIAAPPGCDPTH